MEEILANVQRKHENKVSDLQTTVDRLIKVGGSHAAFIFPLHYGRQQKAPAQAASPEPAGENPPCTWHRKGFVFLWGLFQNCQWECFP